MLANFVDKASVPTFLVETDGILVYANQACAALLGYSLDERIGLNFSALVHPDDIGTAREQIEALVAGKVPSFQAERRYLRKDGVSVWVLTSVSILRGAKGHLYFSVLRSTSSCRRTPSGRWLKSERRWNFALEVPGKGCGS